MPLLINLINLNVVFEFKFLSSRFITNYYDIKKPTSILLCSYKYQCGFRYVCVLQRTKLALNDVIDPASKSN